MSILSFPPTQTRPATPTFSEDDLSEAGRRVSEERYWRDYYEHPDFNYEWNNGILEVKPMADFSQSQLYFWFLRLLEFYLEIHPVAAKVGLEIGFKLNLPHKVTIRKPDLALFLNTNQVLMTPTDRTYWGVFDLCIEFVSDSTRAEVERDTVTKKGEYEAIGVQEYYILDDQGRHTIFYEQTANGLYQPLPIQTGGVIASRVLPGFQFRLEDLYRQPAWTQLIEDVVYQNFVQPAYQAERERANQEQFRADQVEQKLLQERRQLYHVEQALVQEQKRTLSLLRQSLAYRFNLSLDYYDDILTTLDQAALATLSEQVFAVADQAAFEALLQQ